MVFIIGGSDKMRCNPIAENALWIAQMSNDLISMLNGTHVNAHRRLQRQRQQLRHLLCPIARMSPCGSMSYGQPV